MLAQRAGMMNLRGGFAQAAPTLEESFMKSKGTLTVTLCFLGSALALGQSQAPRLPPAPANPPAPSLQSANDPGYAALIAACKNQPPARGGRAGAGGARGGGRGPQAPQGPREYMVTEIPGVV